jgi:hypothetical protein
VQTWEHRSEVVCVVGRIPRWAEGKSVIRAGMRAEAMKEKTQD